MCVCVWKCSLPMYTYTHVQHIVLITRDLILLVRCLGQLAQNMFSNIIKTILVVVGVRGSQFREANDEIYPVAGMVLRSRRRSTLLQRLSSGVIIFECLVLLLNVSSGCQIVKLCQSFLSPLQRVSSEEFSCGRAGY